MTDGQERLRIDKAHFWGMSALAEDLKHVVRAAPITHLALAVFSWNVLCAQ